MERSLSKTVGFGLLGGLAGLVAMRYAKRLTRGLVRQPDPLTPRDHPSMSVVGVHHRDNEPATEALARSVYQKVRGCEPSQRQTRVMGQAVHYGFGLSMATLYAWLRGRAVDHPDPIGGALFGAAVWVVADELAVPLLGLADKPTQYSATAHAHALVGHLAYGAAAGTVVGALRRALPAND